MIPYGTVWYRSYWCATWYDTKWYRNVHIGVQPHMIPYGTVSFILMSNLYYTILYRTVPYRTVRFILMCNVRLYHMVPYCPVHIDVQLYMIPYGTVPFILMCNFIWYHMIPYRSYWCATLYDTIWYRTVHINCNII